MILIYCYSLRTEHSLPYDCSHRIFQLCPRLQQGRCINIQSYLTMDKSDSDSNDSIMSTESERNDDYLKGLDSDADSDYDPKQSSESDEEIEQPKVKRVNKSLW